MIGLISQQKEQMFEPLIKHSMKKSLAMMIVYALEFIMGIIAVYYASKYNDDYQDFKTKDCLIGYNTVSVTGAIDIITGLMGNMYIMMFVVWYIIKVKRQGQDQKTQNQIYGSIKGYDDMSSFLLFHCFKFIFLIANLGAYQQNLRCYDYVIKNAPELWYLIRIYYVMGWFVVGLVSIYTIYRFALRIRTFRGLDRFYKIVPAIQLEQGKEKQLDQDQEKQLDQGQEKQIQEP